VLAGVYSGVGRIECREIDIPRINKNEILLRVKAAAICGTDLRIYRSGHFKIKEGEERILCHEFSGEIIRVGSNIRGYTEGMRVGITPNIGCGICRYCRMGMGHLCPEYDAFGISIDGGFAEYVRIDERAVRRGHLIPFDKSSNFDEIALAEPLSCCYNALNSVKTGPGDRVLIVGAGPMGALHLKLQRLAGAGMIMIADLSADRLEMMKKFGPDVIINTNENDLYSEVMSHTDGMGADVIITACPSPEIQQISVKLASKLGRINFFGGLPNGKEEVSLNTNLIHYNGLIVTGTTGASVSDYETSVKLIEGGKIDTAAIVSKRFDISRIKEAFEYALDGRGLKTLIFFKNSEK